MSVERLGEPGGPEGGSSRTELRAGALGLPAVLMQSIAQIAPAIAVLFTVSFNTSLAGRAAPLTYLVAFVIVLMLSVSLGQLARHFPSAGGYYTYVSRAVSPRLGFLTAWMYSAIAPIAPAAIGVYTGYVLEAEIRQDYGLSVPWWIFFVAIIALVTFAAYRGVQVSGTLLVVLGLAEMATVLALCMWGFFDPGPGGVNFAALNPANSPTLNGFYLAVVFSIFAYTGWEAAATTAEESRDPERIVPRALVGSVLLLGLFVVVCTWGFQLGWGTERLGALASSTEQPGFVLAKELWGPAWVLVLLALLNSAVAVTMACTNVSTRMWFTMARAGVLPNALTRVHEANRTPVNAIWMQAVVALAVGFGASALVGPGQVFFVAGVVFSLGYVLVYAAGNLAVYRFFSRERREEYPPFVHPVFPIVSSIALVWVGYKSVVPLPDPPVSYAPIVAGVWLALGLAVLFVLGRRHDDAYFESLERSAESAAEGTSGGFVRDAGDDSGGGFSASVNERPEARPSPRGGSDATRR